MLTWGHSSPDPIVEHGEPPHAEDPSALMRGLFFSEARRLRRVDAAADILSALFNGLPSSKPKCYGALLPAPCNSTQTM